MYDSGQLFGGRTHSLSHLTKFVLALDIDLAVQLAVGDVNDSILDLLDSLCEVLGEEYRQKNADDLTDSTDNVYLCVNLIGCALALVIVGLSLYVYLLVN